MNIVIDFGQVPTTSVWAFTWYFLAHGGWLLFVLPMIWYMIEEWIASRRIKYRKRWEWVVLSLSLPRLNLAAKAGAGAAAKPPQAVEYIFTSLSGAWKKIDWIERFFVGKIQPEFSFELISREGYLEYLIRAPRPYRDLVEAAIYAQYPDAEIAEVPDYTEKYKDLRWPDNDNGYDIWGTSFNLSKKDFFPIKTWENLKEIDSDPLNSILENLAKIKAGEEFWWQIIVTPLENKWQKKGVAFVKHATGLTGSDDYSSLTGSILGFISYITDEIIYTFLARPEPVKPGEKTVGSNLTAKESAAIESILDKVGKLGFRVTMRAVYIARKEIFNKNKVKEGFLGALHQYTNLYANGLIQSKYTKVSTSHLYYFPQYRVDHYRKNNILQKYRVRSTRKGSEFGTGFILNIGELASLWHFPLGNTRTLMIKKSEAVKAEAPFYLPVAPGEAWTAVLGGREDKKGDQSVQPEEISQEEEKGPPADLPVG
ncbi:MAG: hypothetical protein WCT37_00550 [Patescibacteria group bacterium]|jgi:hypothetical protein